MNPESRVRVELYDPKYQSCWDEFVRQSKNGIFFFQREYLEYHADRFTDFSFVFFRDGQIIAVIPGNRVDDTVSSHGGLTFGGVISDRRMTTTLMLEVFSALLGELRARSAKKLIYKAIPHIYHTIPAEEDLYALFVHRANLTRRDISSTITKDVRIPKARLRRRMLNRGEAQWPVVARTTDFANFMELAAANKEARFGVPLVHTGAEMELLASRFPENIKLYTAHRDGELLGGYIIYESTNVAHTQYVGVTDEARTLGVMDYVIDILLSRIYPEKPFFDFGISTINNGRTLNLGLVRYKEGFGARATVYDLYELNLET